MGSHSYPDLPIPFSFQSIVILKTNTLEFEMVSMVYLTANDNSVEKIRISSSAWAVLNLLNRKTAPLAVYEIQNELPFSERTIYYALRQLQ
ncbi:MAG: hypothetical protein ACFE9A_18900, partial [Candidatus Hodarchaeota archaeon]